MSTTPIKTASSAAPAPAPVPRAKETAPAMQPVQLHPTPAAQLGQFIHPAVLAGVFYVRFPALVDDPVRALQTLVPMVAVVQTVYVSVCLPVAGSQATKSSRKLRPGEKRRQDPNAPNPFVGLFLSLVLSVLLTPILHLAFVLFGAPFLTHIPHTLSLSANFALLALFPLFYVHGVDANTWLAIGGVMAPLDATFGGYLGALLGAWLGAIPIPLDWDREWQKWPVTILCGLYIGYIVGTSLGGSLLRGSRIVGKGSKEE